MGYTTDFYGEVMIDPPLSEEMIEYLNRFSQSRRMGRDLVKLMEYYPEVNRFGLHTPEGWTYGEQGEFFCLPNRVEGNPSTILNQNSPPSTQPGLWCQWIPGSDGISLVWDEGEKFYNADDWMVYLINRILAPAGYKCNGHIMAYGEDHDDVWDITVTDNVITVGDLRPTKVRDELNTLKKSNKELLAEIDHTLQQIEYQKHMKGLIDTPSPDEIRFLTQIEDLLKTYKSKVQPEE